MADEIHDNPMIDYLKKNEGLPFHSLAMGLKSVMMGMGWEPPRREKIPAECPKSYNPYTYCPLAFRHEDDMILDYVTQLAIEIKRINGHEMLLFGKDGRMIDRYACEITAYMNGRIHQILKEKKVKK